MVTIILVFVTLIILLIILTEKVEIRIKSKERFYVEINFTLFSLELSNFTKKNKKTKNRISFSALLKTLSFVIKHGEISVFDISFSKRTDFIAKAVFSALLSAFFAYLDTKAAKINLPSEIGICEAPFTFNISLKSRLYVFLWAFMIYKIKTIGKHVKRTQSVR